MECACWASNGNWGILGWGGKSEGQVTSLPPGSLNATSGPNSARKIESNLFDPKAPRSPGSVVTSTPHMRWDYRIPSPRIIAFTSSNVGSRGRSYGERRDGGSVIEKPSARGAERSRDGHPQVVDISKALRYFSCVLSELWRSS